MEYLALVNELRLPHWLIIAGVALVLFGAIGIILRGSQDVLREAREVGLKRE